MCRWRAKKVLPTSLHFVILWIPLKCSRQHWSCYINNSCAVQCSDIPNVPRHCQKISCLPYRRAKNMYFLKVTNQLLQSSPADLTYTKKKVFEMSIQNASEARFPDWQKETCYWQHYRKKNTCWNTSFSAFAMVWKADNAKRLCNSMQVHPWAKCVTGLGSISKVNLNQTQFSPVAPGISFRDLGGFWCRCNRVLCAWSYQNPLCEGVLRSVSTTSGTHHFTPCISVLPFYQDKPWNINALNL